MKRMPVTARPDWQKKVEALGFIFHTVQGAPYWDETVCYQFSAKEIDTIERATNDLHALCLDAVQHVIDHQRFAQMGIPKELEPLIIASREQEHPTMYGRFDLAYGVEGQIKLLEYNADTPTSLLEAAVIQWQWLEECHPENDQLNSLHEALVARWAEVPEPTIHFAAVWEMLEDRQTLAYLAETAEQAGKTVVLMDVGEIGYSPDGRFTDSGERPIDRLFKLYPWELMAGEPFFAEIGQERHRFTEPAWKMMLSNKGLLPILWELNPGHPLLLPATTNREALRGMGVTRWVEKPFFGREGGGVAVMEHGVRVANGSPPESESPLVYQQRAALFEAGGRHFVWGLWMVGDECRGLSARGDRSPVTGNLSRFYPHRIEG